MPHAPQVIEVSSAPTKKVEHVTIEYKISFSFQFDVEHLVTREEFIALAQKAVLDLRSQMPAHIRQYPELILQELIKRNLVDAESFKAGANGHSNGKG